MIDRLLGCPGGMQDVVNTFARACAADERVMAAFVGGSYARGTADAYSDIDLCLITSDAAYDAFFSERKTFIELLGDPVFLEDFDEYGFDLVCFVVATGVQGEIALGRASRFRHIHVGPYIVLVDKQNLLAGATFAAQRPPHSEQVETLRQLLYWFWHDVAHVITALGRGHVWAAHGHLNDLRLTCVNLARLENDFSVAADGYTGLDLALGAEQLAPLASTTSPIEPRALLVALVGIVEFYRNLARPLSQSFDIRYPDGLERVMRIRLENLCEAAQSA